MSMAVEDTEALIVGAGQGGIAISEHLSRLGVAHLVLERDRIAERWRTGRWDSLVANGPSWHDRFPGAEFPGDPDGFPGKETVAQYFEDYAARIKAPIRCGVEVREVRRRADGPGFVAQTSEGVIHARYVIAATGPFQRPLMPEMVPAEAGVMQLHSAAYRNPDQLPPGAVMVVGCGSSGAQIADELVQAGRKVYLSVGPHGRPPRSYRGRDFVWWLGVLNKWDLEAPPTTDHVTIAVSGANGGKTVDFRRFAESGITLVGRTTGFEGGALQFAPDLAANLARGDRDYLDMLDQADAWAARNGVELPPDPQARVIGPDPDCVTNPLATLDLKAAGVGTILWATGYAFDFGWLKVDAFAPDGRPNHQRGVSTEPGVYFIGLPWQARRGSAFIWGVWHDAKFVADHIAKFRAYLDYAPGVGGTSAQGVI
jgi:putative flavoprotein involved in K+ transport